MKKIFLYNLIIIFILIAIIELFFKFYLNTALQGVDSGILQQSDSDTVPSFNYPYIKNKKVFGVKIFTDQNGFRITEGEVNEKKKKISILLVVALLLVMESKKKILLLGY